MKTLALAAAALLVWSVPQGSAAATMASASSQRLGVTTPDVLAAGAQGTTSLGTNATSASTSINGKSTLQTFSSLLIARSVTTRAGTLRLSLTSSTGLANITQATLSLGATSEIIVTAGSITQSTGSTATLPANGNLTISATALQMSSNAAAATLGIDAVFTGSSSGQAVAEHWTLQVS